MIVILAYRGLSAIHYNKKKIKCFVKENFTMKLSEKETKSINLQQKQQNLQKCNDVSRFKQSLMKAFRIFLGNIDRFFSDFSICYTFYSFLHPISNNSL